MKVKKFITSFSLLGALVALSGCGEALTAKYAGDAEILPGSTCTQDRAERYSMEALVARTDGSIAISITRFKVKEDQSSDGNSIQLEGITARASRSGNTFSAVDQSFNDESTASFDMEGTMSEAGDEVSNLSFTFQSAFSDGTPCRILMRADRLVLLDG
jgi:hypothetical protein